MVLHPLDREKRMQDSLPNGNAKIIVAIRNLNGQSNRFNLIYNICLFSIMIGSIYKYVIYIIISSSLQLK